MKWESILNKTGGMCIPQPKSSRASYDDGGTMRSLFPTVTPPSLHPERGQNPMNISSLEQTLGLSYLTK